jgi:hypothetical protein
LKSKNKKLTRGEIKAVEGKGEGGEEITELINFANRIGIIITFTMIEALRPLKPGVLNGDQRDKLAFDLVSEVLNPQAMFIQFNKLNQIREGLSMWTKNNLRNNKNANWSLYEMDHDKFDKISTLYSSAFPSLSNQEMLNIIRTFCKKHTQEWIKNNNKNNN